MKKDGIEEWKIAVAGVMLSSVLTITLFLALIIWIGLV